MPKEFKILLVGNQLKDILDELKKVKTTMLHIESAAPFGVKEAMSKLHPQLVVFDVENETESLDRMLQQSDLLKSIPWAVTSKQADADHILRFFRMGAVDFLKQPIPPEDVKKLIQKIINLEHAKNGNHTDEASHSFALFSTKGGVGLTTLAANLAVELASKNAHKVLLMDLVLQHGNTADFLDVPAQYTLLDLIENFERMDSNLVENSLTKHASGLYVLPCPKRPEDEDFVNPNQIQEISTLFKGIFNYVIADLGHEFTKSSIAYLDFVDKILLVTTPDVPSLCNARSAIGTLNRMGHGPEKVKLVLNRWHMKGEVGLDEIKKNLSVELFAQIPDDPMNCLWAANQGKTVSQVSAKCDFVKAVRSLASTISHAGSQEAPHVTSRAA